MGGNALGEAVARLLNGLGALATRKAREHWIESSGVEAVRNELSEAARSFLAAFSVSKLETSVEQTVKLSEAASRLLAIIASDEAFPSTEAIQVAKHGLVDFGVGEPDGGWDQ